MWAGSSFFFSLGKHRVKTAGLAVKTLAALTNLGAKAGIIPPEVLAANGLPVPKIKSKVKNPTPTKTKTVNQKEVVEQPTAKEKGEKEAPPKTTPP